MSVIAMLIFPKPSKYFFKTIQYVCFVKLFKCVSECTTAGGIVFRSRVAHPRFDFVSDNRDRELWLPTLGCSTVDASHGEILLRVSLFRSIAGSQNRHLPCGRQNVPGKCGDEETV